MSTKERVELRRKAKAYDKILFSVKFAGWAAAVFVALLLGGGFPS